MSESLITAPILSADFPEIFDLLLHLGLAQQNPHLRALGVEGKVCPIKESIDLEAPLPTPFPTTPPKKGLLLLPKHPKIIELTAEQILSDLLASLLLTNLSHSESVRHRPLLKTVKSLNLLGTVCSTTSLRMLSRTQGKTNGLEGGKPRKNARGGNLGFSNFIRANPEIVSRASESCEQAYALQHGLSPEIAVAIRAGLVTSQALFAPDGLRRVREGDASIVALGNEDHLIQELKNAKTACVISYRHVMHNNGVTGLCQQQLDSVRDEVACYDYVWLDTVYSRASKLRWDPSCVTLFGILDCFRTSEALKQCNRTWIKAERILSSAKQDFWSKRCREYVYVSMFMDIQLSAAKKIAGGALKDSESLFAIDKTRLEEWACNAYTFPTNALSGGLKFQEGPMSTMAAHDHYDWSVLKSPWWPKTIVEGSRLVSPEQLIVSSIDVNALRCVKFDFVLRLLMKMQDKGHCFHDKEQGRLYVLFGDVGNLGARLIVYGEVEVENKGQWMLLTAASYVKECCLAAADLVLIATGMAMNSENPFSPRHLPVEAGRRDDVLLDNEIVNASSYQYVCRFKDVSGLADRDYCPYDFESCMEVTNRLVQGLARGLEYRKLPTVYFGFCDVVQWNETMQVSRARNNIERAGGAIYGVKITE